MGKVFKNNSEWYLQTFGLVYFLDAGKLEQFFEDGEILQEFHVIKLRFDRLEKTIKERLKFEESENFRVDFDCFVWHFNYGWEYVCTITAKSSDEAIAKAKETHGNYKESWKTEEK